MLRLLTDRAPRSLETSHKMQLGSIARWLRRDAPPVWEGELFTVASEGRGRDVVFIHGLAASPECWEDAAEYLGPNMRSHLLHMRGFAGLPPSAFREPKNFLKPMADAVASYIRTLKVGPVPIVGHSMGGLVALIIARDHPDVVDRLMVVDVPAYFSVLINPFATVGTMAGLAEHSRRSYVDKTRSQLESELRRATDKLVTNPATMERIVRWGMSSDRKVTADVMAEVMLTDLRGDMAKIQAPVDVIYAWDKSGHSTRMGLDQAYASSYAGLVRGNKLRIDDARHYVMFDQPEQFYGALGDWLARKA
jgi:pimeloyl-ACP methyl ester carboxylesterase